jgi:hypothetical protein
MIDDNETIAVVKRCEKVASKFAPVPLLALKTRRMTHLELI